MRVEPPSEGPPPFTPSDVEGRPPFLKSWRAAYALVLGWLVVLVILFTVITWIYA